MIFIFMDVNGDREIKVSSPEMDEIIEDWDKHSPVTVRGSAVICSECNEAWPCPTYNTATKRSFDLPEGGEFL